VALDTNVFIYQLEDNPQYSILTDHIFGWLAKENSSAVTSTITMTELLVQPYRKSDQSLADRYYGLLSTFPNLTWIAPGLEIADIAARLRELHRFRTPDALQAATAVFAGATAMITNDAVFERVEAFETVVLDSYL